MPYLAYSLTPLNYYLFQSLALFLHLQCFNNQKEVETSVKEFFISKDKNWYQHGIKELAEK